MESLIFDFEGKVC